MISDSAIATGALTIGLIQMYQTFEKIRKDDDNAIRHTRGYVIMSIISGILWFIYQYRRSGVNYTLAYTTTGIILESYILYRILNKAKWP
jgi:uncharacterized protein with PQ loop repeat